MGSRRDRDQALSPVSGAPRASGTREATISDAPVTVDEGVAQGRATIPDLPGMWLDRLLVASTQLPYSEGADGALRVLVGTLTQILPDTQIGVRLPAGEGEPRRVLRSEPPSGQQPILPGSSRMFPDCAHERSVTFSGEQGSGSLHFASDDAALDDDRSALAHLLDRASLVAADALRKTREHELALAAHAELRAIRAHLVQAEKLASLGQIAAGMVHELNNPLTSIVAYTDYLLKRMQGQASTDPEDVERVRRIAESANRMLRFTRDLVSYARPSSDVPVPVPVHTVISRALAFCEHEIAQAGATVVCDFDADVESVRGVPEQLAQVFVNLVTNACHSMAAVPHSPSRQGKLAITTSLVDEGARVRVIVEDNGHGIDPVHLPHIFAPFFTTKGAERGTGLGLSIVKSIVDGHDGDIRVESDPSRGARFILNLPVRNRE